MCNASRAPQAAAAAASGQRGSGTPCPIDTRKLVAPATAMLAPQATSMTLCLPVLTPMTKATATTERIAQAVTSTVSQNTRRPSLPPGREDLVDAHPALLERERAAREVQPPHPGPLPADDGLHCGPVPLQVVQPA